MSTASIPSVASRRAKAAHTSMFVRMLVRAAVLRRGRAASALLAMIVAAAVATAMLNLYVDVQAKLRREFRNYGANIVVVSNAPLPPDALEKAANIVRGRGLAVPFSYVIARTNSGDSVVVSGTDFSAVRELNRWWSVSQWPSAGGSALVGIRAASVVSPQAKPFDLTFQGRTIHLTPTGTVQTGAAEDSRIYISSADFERWTRLQPSTIEIAASGSATEIDDAVKRLSSALPSAEVRPVRQIMEGEARVLGKTRSTLLATATLIVFTAALCVLSTLVGWVFDRRRDFAIMKALGASERLVSAFFAAEAAALGAAGATFGFVIGAGVAIWIGRANFHAPVVPRFSILPIVFAGSILVALVAAVLPMGLLRRVQPATILRGE